MPETPAFAWPRLPAAYDADAVARGLSDWADMLAALARQSAADRKIAAELSRLADMPGSKALLDALFGNSPYLTELALLEPAMMLRLLRDGPAAMLEAAHAQVRKAIAATTEPDQLMQPLRQAKRRIALGIAVADISGLWTLEQVTGCLSDFASLAVDGALAVLLREAAARGDLELPDPKHPCRGSGLVALGMGKLGARELNYSSDIDLIMLFDQEVVRYRGRKSPLECFVRITQQMVRLLNDRTEDGYVFRTDLRLRPDPGSTPVILSMAAAEAYYESFGQNWERAAMIKARPVGGDLEAGLGFLSRLTPYVWRKNLDFAAIEDIHSIKRQIHAHRGHADIAVEGHNLKVGRGGIREVEFFAQTQQLIAGGRDSRLRRAATKEALLALVDTGRLQQTVADSLIADYTYLREIEHRLQMINDEQTHSLPDSAEGLAAVACFAGAADVETFRQTIFAVLNRVKGHYDQLFSEAPSLGSERGSLVFTGTDDDPDTLETLRGLGFSAPSEVAAMIRGWHFGRYRAMRSERAREKLTAIMPSLLEAFSKSGSADAAIQRFDRFLEQLPSGVQVFSLLQSNPEVLNILAEFLAAAPHLADTLAANTALFDSLLEYAAAPPDFSPEKLRDSLARQLKSARDFQDVLDWTRRWTAELRLQIGIGLLRGSLDGEVAGVHLSQVADVVLGELYTHVMAEFARQHGEIKGARVALLGMGRLGSQQLTLESDLDLIMLYDLPRNARDSDGPRPLSPGAYFARACPRFINAITAMTGEGRLFEVDMRLRPSGNAGPIASALDGFLAYQQKEAWTWEHMALTRARVVMAPQAFAKKVEQMRFKVLGQKRDPKKLLADVASMRRRLAQAKPPRGPWSLKLARGGLVDIEFITQYLQLLHGARHPEVLLPNPIAALAALREAKLLDPAQAETLLAAARLQGHLLAVTRLAGEASDDPARWPVALAQRLPALFGCADVGALTDRLIRTQNGVADIYQHLVDQPAAPYLALADLSSNPTENGDSNAQGR